MYLLLDTRSGGEVQLVASKTRVSLLKAQTIPCLKLPSALLLARLMDTVSKSLEIELQLSVPCCFTDSTVALSWTRRTDKSWKPFVQNRVNEIRSLLSPSRWKHCSGKDNPADIPSRGLAPLELSMNQLWRNRPEWLVLTETPDEDLAVSPECVAEMKMNSVHGLMTSEDSTGLSQIIRCEDFSSYNHLISVTALVLKFCHLLQCRLKNCGSSNLRSV